jgi:hypothetical protein
MRQGYFLVPRSVLKKNRKYISARRRRVLGSARKVEAAMSYELTWTVPYEGDTSESFASLEDVLSWLAGNRSRYEFSLDNVTLRGPVGEIDLYGLYERCDAGLPLLDPDYEAATNELLAVLGAIRAGCPDDSALESLDRVRATVVRLIDERNAAQPRLP